MELIKTVLPKKSFRIEVNLERHALLGLRAKAVRRRVWFKVLSRLERGLVDLSLRVTEQIRSRMLATAVSSVVKKLVTALESKVRRQMRLIGVPLAKKISQIARKWGNQAAREWQDNPGFIQYLAVMSMNKHPCGGS